MFIFWLSLKWVMALLPGHIQYSPVFVWLFSFLVFLLTSGKCRNSIYFSLPTCESRHILLSLWRLGGVLIHFFTDVYNFSLCYLFFTSPVYHYTRFWNFLWELSVKLVVCSLDSLSCRIISRNWTQSGADVFQVYSIFFSRDHPRLILGWIGYFMSLFFHWSRGCC